MVPAEPSVEDMMAAKQKELEDLKKRQMELEIAKAKAQLEAQERELAELRARAMAPIAPTVVAVSIVLQVLFES